MARATARFCGSTPISRGCGSLNIPSVGCRGRADDTGGAVLVKLATLDEMHSFFHKSFDLIHGERSWVEMTSGQEPVMSDESISRRTCYDPDLWVVESKTGKGRHSVARGWF